MSFESKFNLKFYITTFIHTITTIFAWYGIYLFNANQILYEDNTPISAQEQFIFTILFCLIALSWSVSLIVMIRQIFIGSAFYLDDDGIYNTLNAIIILAFIFVIPVKQIPRSAIINNNEIDGVMTVTVDKSKVSVLSVFKPFLRKQYHFCQGFTKPCKDKINRFLYKE